MRRLSVLAGITLSSILVIGCAGAPTMQEVPGGIYANYKMGKEANGAVGAKEGKACATSILGWFGTGDASVATAASNGGISKVTSIDREANNVLGIYAEYCTVVHGD